MLKSKLKNKLLHPRHLTLALSISILCSLIFTYLAIMKSGHPLGPDPHEAIALILLNLTLLLFLGIIVSRRAMVLWHMLRQGSAASKLQTRILVLFSLLTIIPAVFVSVFAAVFFHFGVQSWFNQRVNTALEQSVAVARSYLVEHREIIRSDAVAMANGIDAQMHLILSQPSLLNKIVNGQAELRSLTEAVIIQRNRIIAQTALSFSLAFEQIESDKQERALSGDIVIWLEDEDKLRAMVKLHSMPDTYLVIGKLMDEKVLRHMNETTGAVAEYRRLKANLSEIQIQFSFIFGLVVLLLLLVAIWFGMHFAARIVIPITRLIRAAEKVRQGDFSAKVPISQHEDEVATLGRAFNRMTEELQHQRDALIDANQQIDERRRFSETVLSGISAGVLALDKNQNLNLYNKRALQLIPLPENLLNSNLQLLAEEVPELKPLLKKFASKADLENPLELVVHHQGRTRTLLTRITTEKLNEMVEGYIVTFDDITDLLAAQRSAAWSDVARRVAHEIKNPLTPIQLAAERLRRKYGKQIHEDKETYERYIETISRHVGDVGRIVEEFVSFARMPAPILALQDLGIIAQKVIFSEQVTHPEIEYILHQNPAEKTIIMGDEQQLNRLFINLFKNAAEAYEKVENTHNKKIECHFQQQPDYLVLTVTDNGPGFPAEHIHRLMEPYMTTREKGTGLGLAIVQKIVEEHKGSITLSNHPEGGAQVIIKFPIDSDKIVT